MKSIIIILGLFLCINTASAQLVDSLKKENNKVAVIIKWDQKANAKKDKKKINEIRIDKNSTVSLHIKNFNFFHYTLAYKIDEETVESYQALDKLWQQAFRITGLIGSTDFPTVRYLIQPTPSPTTPQSAFQIALSRWERELLELENTLDIELDKVPTTIKFSGTNIDTASIGRMRKNLSTKPQTVLADHNNESLAHYKKIKIEHNKLMERTDAFLATAKLVKNGQIKSIGKKKSGTIITVTAQPKNKDKQDTGKPYTLEYFVHSHLPVLFHTGFAFNGLKNIEFDKVSGLNQQDLYAKVKADSTSTDFTAFLSYELPIKNWKNFTVLGTLGTNLASPGEQIYIGGSLKLWERLFFTYGRVSGEVEKENNTIIDVVGTQLKTRELFDTITKHRDWSWFASVSLSVY